MFHSRALNFIMLGGVLLRAIPLLIWTRWPCVRDECTYLRLADRMVEGEGMTSSVGWLWAPGYPTLIAFHQFLIGKGSFIKGTQVAVSVGIIYLIYLLAKRFALLSLRVSEDEELTEQQEKGVERAGLLGAVLYAFSPTQIFFCSVIME